MTELRPQEERHERRHRETPPSRTFWRANDLSIKDEPLLWALIKYRLHKDRQRVNSRYPYDRSNLVSSLTTAGSHKPILDLDYSHIYYPSGVPDRGFINFLFMDLGQQADTQSALYKAGLSKSKSPYGNIQFDAPHEYIPSSNDGHAHLYLDTELSTWTWRVLMWRLYRAGAIELGYFVWSIRRGMNSVRLPNVAKTEKGSYSYGWIFKLRKKK